jgi:drug/metabolite transporter (DMT)-like permease
MFQLFGVPALFLMIVLFTSGIKEKRERFHALLPVPLKQRGVASLLLIAILFHAGILSIWPVQFFVERSRLANEFIPFWGVLVFNGVTISIVFMIAIRFDLQRYNKRQKYLWIVTTALWIVLSAAALILILLKSISEKNREIYELIHGAFFYSPVAALAANIICACMMYLSIAIYARRDSYLA